MKESNSVLRVCLDVFFIACLIASLCLIFTNLFALWEPDLNFIFIKPGIKSKIINLCAGIVGVIACIDAINRQVTLQKTKNLYIYTLIISLLSLL